MRIDFQNAILLILCLTLLFCVFTLSASAVDWYDFSEYVVPYTTDTQANAKQYGVIIGYYYGQPLYTITPSNHPVYYFYVSSENKIYFATNRRSQNVKWYRFSSNGQFAGSDGLTLDSGLYEGYYFKGTSASNYTLAEMPTYTTLADGQAALLSWIADPTPPAPPTPFEYTLPPGNVAYIPIPTGQSSAITYTLTTTYYMAFGNNDTSRINQVVTVMSALPSSTNNLAPSSPKIPWTNNGNVNLLGVSANKIYQGSIPTNYGGHYLVVVNPMTMSSQPGLIGGDTYTNGSINISVSAVSGSPHIYPMSESLTITPGDGIGSESTYGDTGYTYEIDPETGEIIWTDPDGGSGAPVAGGNNPMPSPNTIFDWLRNISQQFSDFLRGPVQAVQVVVSAIRDFMGSFTQLYQWLPSPVYSLITSALMIALTIGVIKIFV